MVSGNRNTYQYGKPLIRPDDSDSDIAAKMPLKNTHGVLIGKRYMYLLNIIHVRSCTYLSALQKFSSKLIDDNLTQ